MQHVANGVTLALIAPTGGVKAGVAYMHGEMFVVPTKTADAGANFEAYRTGNYEGFEDQLADGVTPDFEGEAAYWILADNKLTTTKTTDSKNNVKVGYFANLHGFDALHLIGA